MITQLKKEYKALSRMTCENYCMKKHTKPSIIISIKSSYDNVKPNVFTSANNKVKDILFLSFDDVDKEQDPKYCMDIIDGKKIATFVNKWYHDVDSIIVHCDGGISRSAGVIAAIMRVKEGTDFNIFNNKNKYPNMTCYLHTLKGFKYI